MIAVLVPEDAKPVVREFFELFKTPWKFYDGSPADVLVCMRHELPSANAKLVLIYNGEPDDFDRKNVFRLRPAGKTAVLRHNGWNLPIYGSCLVVENSDEPAIIETNLHGRTFIRIGYDLFSEVRWLLTKGQPVENASVPSLDVHITVLRSLLLKHSVPLVEIPSTPLGVNLIACMTHDVDHAGLRNHWFDHTMFGFLYRATVGSVIDLYRGKKETGQLAANFLAAVSVPFMHLRLMPDIWLQFDHYAEIESGLNSTFFVIPKKGETGLDARGGRPARRAAKYDAAALTGHFEKLRSAGHEIGVHGIDAWRDSAAGREEQRLIVQFTGVANPGVRMHWLFFNENSPAVLEDAGFTYDSTVGYNATVGYRAGTAQVFKPLCCKKLLELPMHAMDTALFYPAYLNLSPMQAREKLRPLVAHTANSGGVLTVNWHDRSLAPERLWDDSYKWLLSELKAAGAWFATAAQTVSWFRNRRAITFETAHSGGRIKIRMPVSCDGPLPGLRVRVHQPAAGDYMELPLRDGMEISLAA